MEKKSRGQGGFERIIEVIVKMQRKSGGPVGDVSSWLGVQGICERRIGVIL